MKTMRRVAAVVLALLLMPLGALAESVGAAMPLYDLGEMRARLSYEEDAESGNWSAGADPFEALWDGLSRSGVDQALIFQLKWMGNTRTGLVQPVLEIIYAGGRKILAGAVSIKVGAVRYDLRAASEEIKLGNRRGERVLAPLTGEGLSLIEAMRGADSLSVRLHGAKTYSTDITRAYKGTNARKKLESGALNCLGGGLDLKKYRLWDLSAAAWEAEHGFVPRVQAAEAADKGFGMLSPGDSGAKVRALQKGLVERLFLYGTADGTYGEKLREAVLRAQKYYGLMETGSADAALTDCLERGDAPAVERGEEEEMDGELRLSRYWLANRVMPRNALDALASQEAENRDNLLLIIEGEVRNDTAEALDLDRDLVGTVALDGYEYPCSFLCERDNGTGFARELLPGGRARLVIMAEIPGAAVRFQQGEARIAMGGEARAFALADE